MCRVHLKGSQAVAGEPPPPPPSVWRERSAWNAADAGAGLSEAARPPTGACLGGQRAGAAASPWPSSPPFSPQKRVRGGGGKVSRVLPRLRQQKAPLRSAPSRSSPRSKSDGAYVEERLCRLSSRLEMEG